MNAADLTFAPATEIARLVGHRDVTAREVTEAFLKRVEAIDHRLNCFIIRLAGGALDAAARIDAAVQAGRRPGPLAGVPIAVKDLADVAGVPTTAGAHQRFHTHPRIDAPVVARLRAAGAVLIGKTNLHEFAYGVTNINPHFGPTRNPWDLRRIPGGSSGGSAAAVAAGMCAAAMGTDTGGSIRIPAALCGVVGLKPTYGRVPKAGILPLAWTLDHAGPLTRTVLDAAVLLKVMSGSDPADSSSAGVDVPPFDELLGQDIRGLRIGVPREYFWERLDDEVSVLCEDALGALRNLGAVVKDVSLSLASAAGSAVAVIIAAEATAVHERWLQTHPEDCGQDLRTRLERGFFISAVDYLQAQRARSFLTREFVKMFADVDVLVTPTTPSPATPIEEEGRAAAETSLAMSMQLTRFTNPFNLTGLPAISVPCGFSAQGLPMGLQIVGRPWDEAMVLRVGHAYEQATEWHKRRPPLATNYGTGD